MGDKYLKTLEMSTAAIVIDNFLTTDQWNTIQAELSVNGFLTSGYQEARNSLHSQINEWIETKLRSINIWQNSWKNEIPLFSSLNVTPKGIDRESGDIINGGYHREDGGYIFYIHPKWESTWGGNLKFKDCDVAQVEPTPNRFVWVNPSIWHGIEVVSNDATNNRITVVAWPEGTVEYPSATQVINTSS